MLTRRGAPLPEKWRRCAKTIRVVEDDHHGQRRSCIPPLARSTIALMTQARERTRLSREGILYRQSVDALPVLQVLTVEPGAPRGEGGGNDQGVVEGIVVAGLEIQCAMVQCLGG